MSAKRKLVAVVDDDLSILKGVERLLLAYGFEAEVFNSAEGFLGRKAEAEISALILDIHLGGMSGIDLRKKLVSSGSTVPVIFITAVGDEAEHNEALSVGGIACLQKPFTAESLLTAINKAAS